MLSPGSFARPDLYSRRQWRRAQQLADKFWSRWRKQFLSTLQTRSKWTTEKTNFKINDIAAEAARNCWPMGQILEINKEKNNVFFTGVFRLKAKTWNTYIQLYYHNVNLIKEGLNMSFKTISKN